MSRVIITGGSGFIGTNLVEYLHHDHEVKNIDIKEPKNKSHIHLWEKIDINNFYDLNNVITSFQPDYLIHLAARTDLHGKTLEDYKTNTKGVENILSIVKNCKSLKKVIITSSMLVCHAGYTPQHQKDYSPTTMYGKSKCITEELVWNAEIKVDWLIIRPTSIWGPWFDVPYRNFFDMIISKKYFHLGDKSGTKTYGYVENSIHQIMTLLYMNTKPDANKVFYIGDYQAYKIEDWANEIAFELGIRIRKLPFSVFILFAKVGDILNKCKIMFPMTSFRLANMTTNNIIDLTETIKYVPALPVSRKDGIRKTLDWIRK